MKSTEMNMKIKKLEKEFTNGTIYLDATQRIPTFKDGIIKKHLYHAVNDKKLTAKQRDVLSKLDGTIIDEKWRGECAIVLVPTTKGFACTDGGHRLTSFKGFLNGVMCKNFKYPENSDIEKFYAKLAKKLGKSIEDSFCFEELPEKYQKAFLEMELLVSITFSNAKNATGESFIDSNRQKNQTSMNLLNATFANTEFYKTFNETAKCIANFNVTKGLEKKSTPSWYSKAKKTTQESYIEVCKGLKYTKKKHAAIFKLLLRCANCADWTGGTSFDVHYNICKEHSKMSKTSCVDLMMNTIDNMAMVPKLLDVEYLDGMNVWTAIVYTFGVPSYKSYAVKATTRKPLAISGRFLKNRKIFNNAFGDCVAGNKTTFKGSNLVLTNSAKNGTVFVPKMLRESPSGRKNLTTVAMVLTAIYNETKEVK